MKKKLICDCGHKYNEGDWYRHSTTLKHCNYLLQKLKCDIIPDGKYPTKYYKDKEYRQMYSLTKKEELREYAKKYYQRKKQENILK